MTEALGGGVQSAIAHFIESSQDFNHIVYGRARDGEDTVTSGTSENWPAPTTLPAFAHGIRRAIRAADADVVHFHSSIAGALRPVAPKAVRVVYSPHCYAFERKDIRGPQRSAYRTTERLLSTITDCVVAVSPHEAELARKLGARNVVTVSNLAPRGTFRPRHSPSSRSVATVGRISAQKDPLLFAEIAANDQTGLHFIWIGDGDPGLRAALVESGVEVTGWRDQESIRATLQGCGLYLHTAAWEASPMSLTEALEWGIPVLCRDNQSLRSLGYECVGNSAYEIGVAVSSYFTDVPYREHVLAAASTTTERLLGTPTETSLQQAYGSIGVQV